MNRKTSLLAARRLAGYTMALVLVPGFFGACSSTGGGKIPPEVAAAYRAAVRDAEIATEEDIHRALRPIAAGERGLIWQSTPGESPVLVVTWTDWDGYDAFVGKEMSLSRPVWVTLVPELQELCRHYHPRRRKLLTRRLEQWLGLPPGDGKTRFVELWVDPTDLLRPCPDPEITDQECALEFPEGDALPLEYRRWFEEQKASTYGPEGYPWTRLGYTYDWGSRTTIVGASEYLIWSPAKVQVHSVGKLRSYCGS